MNLPRHSERPQARVHALLGPTNTGKTHRAIERMLDFDSGMIGLPLRLLAREVYDRVSSRIGEQAVALVTGEEKRVPARPRYWICTVEAMPASVPVEFLAVDEIQLITHPERGHVFTDRLLFWRGTAETWFLGSDTVEGLVRELLVAPRIDRLPRLSRLRYTGQSSLRTLPRRSAVVAFSMQQVYELADVLRVRRGGAAVVLGALSPRVRNAQVALYQAGEVDFLVATDAIGMGLNLDIEHVALAAHTKFDGFETRALEPAELAQIVGRAGRYLRDGSFGTLSPEPELSERTVQQLESHRFTPQRSAYYRNAQLELGGLAGLVADLERRPTHAALRPAPESDDLRVLRVFSRRPDIEQLARDARAVATVWDVCRIPNYERRIPEHQAERMMPLLAQLVQRGQLSPEYLDEQVRRLERYDGDIDVLLERLSAVRTWTYVSHQGGWLDDATHWQERTRTLEDRLGDLLHERLLTRFVSARPVRRSTGPRASIPAAKGGNSHHAFAKLSELEIYVDADRQAARSRERWTEDLVEAGFDAFTLEAGGEIHFGGERVARLADGQSPLLPVLKPMLPDWVDPGARGRIERRLAAHVKDVVAHLIEPLYPAGRAELARARDSAPLRGLLYQLEQGLGTVSRRQVAEQLQSLRPRERDALVEWEIELGSSSVYARAMLSPERMRTRAALSGSFQRARVAEVPGQPRHGKPLELLALDAALWPLGSGLDHARCLRLGFVPLTRWAVRCDVLELLLERLPRLAVQSLEARVAETRLLLGCSGAEASAVLPELPRKRKNRRRRARRSALDEGASAEPKSARATRG